jgi:hypothetical protein
LQFWEQGEVWGSIFKMFYDNLTIILKSGWFKYNKFTSNVMITPKIKTPYKNNDRKTFVSCFVNAAPEQEQPSDAVKDLNSRLANLKLGRYVNSTLTCQFFFLPAKAIVLVVKILITKLAMP